MSVSNILICDEDKEYLDAMTEYFLSSKHGGYINIFTYNNPYAYAEEIKEFDVGLLSESFLKIERKCQLQRLYFLSEERIKEENDNIVFKYQSMDNLMGKVFGRAKPQEAKEKDMIVVISPIFHELRLPFSICLCEMFSEAGEVLFLDFEQFSIVNNLVNQYPHKDLLDCLYLLENDSAKDRLGEFLVSCGNFYYLPPMHNSELINEVYANQWIKLFTLINDNSFSKVVILMDVMVQGFWEIIESCGEIVILGKTGSYYEISMRAFEELIKTHGFENKVRRVDLPMSAAGLSGENLSIDGILNGNLKEFVRREMGYKC